MPNINAAVQKLLNDPKLRKIYAETAYFHNKTADEKNLSNATTISREGILIRTVHIGTSSERAEK